MGLRTFLLALFAVSLMFLDYRLHDLSRVRSVLATVTVPVEYLMSVPGRIFNWLGADIATEHRVLLNNAKLRARELMLQARLEKLIALEKENNQLRVLLKSSAHSDSKVTAAELLAIDTEPFVQQVILNEGSHKKVFVGQPVLDAFGVMGQVINVSPFTSRVLLVTDQHSAIPVQNNRNGIRAIAIGQGSSGVLSLINVPDTTDVHVGDTFVTSGLGQRFPEGYPVGQVISVVHSPGERFTTIFLKSSAHIDSSREVLLVWPTGKGST